MPRLEEFNTFCKVVEQKSFSRAAELLGLTQPAVSLQMKSLEESYGAELLHRRGMNILPTEAGRSVYEYACQLLRTFDKSQQVVQSLRGSMVGRLQIGASTGPGEALVPLLLGRFKQQHPEVTVALQVGSTGEILDGILHMQLEVGFVGSQRRDRYLTFEPYLEDELVLVVNPQHPWASRSRIAYQELLTAPLILQQQGSGATSVLQDALAEQGISLRELNVVMELGLQESTKAAVRAGFGVTIISHLGVREDLQRGDLVAVPVEELELKRGIYLCTNRSQPLSNLAQTFLDFARAEK